MLEVKNLSISFGADSPPVVEDVNLSIKDGTKTVIIGETGSGKSVLLLSILRLLPGNANICGSVILDGEELLSLDIKAMYSIRGRKIGYVPQSSGNSLNPLLTIGQQMDEAMRINSELNPHQRKQAIIKQLREFNLGNESKIYNLYPHQISGGMKQRVLVAMGLCTNAHYIFADEPTKGIDASRLELISRAFKNLDGRTLLCVTHDLAFAESIGDYATVMYAAQQVELCSVKDLFFNPLHPYTKAMLQALPKNGAKATMGFAPPHEEFTHKGCRFYDRCSDRCEQCLAPPPMVSIDGRKVRCWKYVD